MPGIAKAHAALPGLLAWKMPRLWAELSSCLSCIGDICHLTQGFLLLAKLMTHFCPLPLFCGNQEHPYIMHGVIPGFG